MSNNNKVQEFQDDVTKDDLAKIKKEAIDPEIQKIIDKQLQETKKEDNDAAKKVAEQWMAERFNYAHRIIGFIQSTGVPLSLGIEAMPYAFVIALTNIVSNNATIPHTFIDKAAGLLKDAEKTLINVSNSMKANEEKMKQQQSTPVRPKQNS